eukprot:2579562-Rhodomonas_salina.1
MLAEVSLQLAREGEEEEALARCPSAPQRRLAHRDPHPLRPLDFAVSGGVARAQAGQLVPGEGKGKGKGRWERVSSQDSRGERAACAARQRAQCTQ